jgi:hypothetical protein
MPAGSRLPAICLAACPAAMLRALEWILLDYVHGSFYKTQSNNTQNPPGQCSAAPRQTDLPALRSDYALPLWTARERLVPDGRIIGGA